MQQAENSFRISNGEAIGLRRKFGKLSTIGKLAPTIRVKEKPTGDCRYFEIGDLSISKGAFENGTYYLKGEAPNNAQRKFDIGDVAVSTRRPNRGAIAVVEDGCANNFYSVFLARLKPKNINFGYWLKEFLRHEAGKLLLQQRCTWTTYPVISEDDLETIPVPVIESDWEYISTLSKRSVRYEDNANRLTSAAKFLVEALIEGQLTEAELIAAEQALQAGNDQLDRRILNRLKTDGIDCQGPALFGDLDELYHLLRQAEVD
jgi:type I restriction enzyme S subunit